jgi:hypothetical protein
MNRAINPTLMLIPAELLGQVLAIFLVLGESVWWWARRKLP